MTPPLSSLLNNVIPAFFFKNKNSTFLFQLNSWKGGCFVLFHGFSFRAIEQHTLDTKHELAFWRKQVDNKESQDLPVSPQTQFLYEQLTEWSIAKYQYKDPSETFDKDNALPGDVSTPSSKRDSTHFTLS